MCVSAYRTPCSNSSMYMVTVMMCGIKLVTRLFPPITGLSLRNVYYGTNDERGNSAPGRRRN